MFAEALKRLSHADYASTNGEPAMNIQLLRLSEYCLAAKTGTLRFLERRGELLLGLLGIGLLIAGLHEVSFAQSTVELSRSEANFDDGLIRGSVGNLFKLIEGAFGALVMVVSGLGAIIASAMGAYRAAVGLLVVAVGSFILRSLVSLFFGTEFEGFDPENG